jgi:hypothetical protein
MFTYTFANTAQFRSFFGIADDMSVEAATDLVKQYFVDNGVEMDVWLSAAGWVVRNDGSTPFIMVFNKIVDAVKKEVDAVA